MKPEDMNQEGVSRRDLLRRGAALGGALAWATPVVQVIGMSPALALASSPVIEPDCINPESFYSKYEGDAGAWEADGSPHCARLRWQSRQRWCLAVA